MTLFFVIIQFYMSILYLQPYNSSNVKHKEALPHQAKLRCKTHFTKLGCISCKIILLLPCLCVVNEDWSELSIAYSVATLLTSSYILVGYVLCNAKVRAGIRNRWLYKYLYECRLLCLKIAIFVLFPRNFNHQSENKLLFLYCEFKIINKLMKNAAKKYSLPLNNNL